mmetsp:Transcript_3200/g.3473  ORF Transcript_3200/g.3473 Transcript_3200/m.3473 type:complete len:553 (-) Transcript_3200:211-1869(-)
MKPSSKSSHKSSLEGSEGKLPSSKAGKVSSSKSPVSTTNLAWVLGKFYNLDTDKEEFRSHAESFFRFTYRRDFPALEPYPITSDSGWGCMLRAAQMMMGYLLRRHYFGPDWRVPKAKDELLRKNDDYCEILRWFLDFPGFPHIYSLHHITQSGMKYDKLPGEWYGPSTASYVLRDLSKIHRLRYQGEIAVMVTQGEAIYISEVEKLCSNISLNENFFGLQDSNHLLNNTTFTEKFQRLSMNFSASNRPRKNSTNGRPISTANVSSVPNVQNAGVGSKISQETKTSHEKIEKLDDPPTLHPLEINPLTSESNNEKDDFFDPLFRPPPSQLNPWVYSLVLLLPLRLGINSVNEEYIAELKEVLQNPACIGILGGRPNHAIYFVGYHVKDNVLYGLDPHTVYSNPSGDVIFDQSTFPTDDYIHQIHVKDFVTLDFKQLDPSLAIGFYFQNRQEFNDFCLSTRAHNDRLRQMKLSPLYSVEHTAPAYLFDEEIMNGMGEKASPHSSSTSPQSSQRAEKRGTNVAATEKILQSMGMHEDDFDERKNSEDLDDDYVFL